MIKVTCLKFLQKSIFSKNKYFLPLKKSILSPSPYFFSTLNQNTLHISLMDEVEGKVFNCVKQLYPKVSINDANKKFSEIGIDSLDSTQLIVAMEQTFEIDLSDEQVLSISSINDAIDLFFKKINARVTNKVVEFMESQAPTPVKSRKQK